MKAQIRANEYDWLNINVDGGRSAVPDSKTRNSNASTWHSFRIRGFSISETSLAIVGASNAILVQSGVQSAALWRFCDEEQDDAIAE